MSVPFAPRKFVRLLTATLSSDISTHKLVFALFRVLLWPWSKACGGDGLQNRFDFLAVGVVVEFQNTVLVTVSSQSRGCSSASSYTSI